MEGLRLVPCGDRALFCYLGDHLDDATNRRVHGLARALRGVHPAVVEVTPGFHAVMLEYDPVRIRLEHLTALVEEAAAGAAAAGEDGREVEIPVVYGGEYGPDLEAVAAHTGLAAHEVVARHSGRLYRVYCLGFSPGFPYLGELDPALSVPRLSDPRVRVPGGSVGIGGAQTGIYPAASPGGWRLIGRTPVRLFDPDRTPPALLQPGDRVRFVPAGPEAFEAAAQEPGPVRAGAVPFEPGRTGLRVIQPGLQTTIQDLGRRGYTAYGVPVAGAVDQQSLMIGNWLLGNRARTAALEIAISGPEVEFTGPAAFAITGASIPAELIPADGGSPRPVPGWTSVLASPGDRLRMGTVTAGCRAYLCVAGGFDLPPVLGSLSEDLFGHIGPLGRPLAAGDWLPLGLPLHPPADLAGRSLPPDALPAFEGSAVIRATLGPQADHLSEADRAALFGATFLVGPQANRQGLRLIGPAVLPEGPAEMLSEPIPPGAVQVVPSGQPILLLGNRQTLGGYPKVAVAVFTDLWAAAQLKEGDRIRFQRVETAEGHAIAWQERRRLGQIRRYLEKGMGTALRPSPPEVLTIDPQPDTKPPTPASAHPAAQPAARHGTATPVRRYRITIDGIEFLCEVEEVGG
ncbi:5-oxoprolinase subunit PxpB [Symbiobacterium terraclitae]|uniref:5-oxoprolinase subunit PxpB n=1 Tax=Symbiobacterium terraclitae TaxID=557451 RepID=UPI0035B51A70